MADVRTVFPILADSGTGAGEPAISRVEGESSSAIEGLIGFSFKDSSGNVILPQLTADGKLPVDTEGTAGVCKTGNGEDTSGSVGSYVTVASFTGALTKVYQNFGVIVSCRRAAKFILEYVDDDGGGGEAVTKLAEYDVGAGFYTACCEISCIEVDTTGGTATQTFRIRGQNLHTASNLRATLAAKEI